MLRELNQVENYKSVLICQLRLDYKKDEKKIEWFPLFIETRESWTIDKKEILSLAVVKARKSLISRKMPFMGGWVQKSTLAALVVDSLRKIKWILFISLGEGEVDDVALLNKAVIVSERDGYEVTTWISLHAVLLNTTIIKRKRKWKHSNSSLKK